MTAAILSRGLKHVLIEILLEPRRRLGRVQINFVVAFTQDQRSEKPHEVWHLYARWAALANYLRDRLDVLRVDACSP